MKTDLFQSCGHCWVFQIYLHIECSTFRASSFRIWSSSTGIPSPPLALFLLMLPKAHLTSHSRMCGSKWMIAPSWRDLQSFSFYCLFCIDHWGRLSSLLAILWNSTFKWVYLSFPPLPLASVLFTAICKASSDNHFAFLHFFFLEMSWPLPPVQCHKPPSIVLQALCLSDRIPWIYMSSTV